MRVPMWMAIVALVGCARGPVLRQPVGESTVGTTRLTSAPILPSRPQEAPASGERDQARREPDACASMTPSVEFSFDSAVVNRTEDADLQNVARCLATPSLASATVLLVGHADPSGPSSYNLALGLERAHSVKEELVKKGIAAERIITATSGEAGAAREGTADGRRVDVWIRREGGGVAAPPPTEHQGAPGIPLWGPVLPESR